MMMIMMKKPVILVICTLLISSLTVSVSAYTYNPNECCFEFIQKQLPKRKVQNYRWTDNKCAKPAVILVMGRGNICANPNDDWVMKIIQEQNRKKESYKQP